MLKILPIVLFFKTVAVQTRNRLKANGSWLQWQGFGYKKQAWQIERIEVMAREIETLNMPCNYRFSWLRKRGFGIVCPDREVWK